MLPWVQEKLSGGRQRLLNIFSRHNESDSDQPPVTDSSDTMFVSELGVFGGETIKIHVIYPDGNKLTVDVTVDCTVDRLKLMIVNRFHTDPDVAKVARNYKLVSVFGRKTLIDEQKVAEEELKNNDQVLLLKRRDPPVREKHAVNTLKAPTAEEIKEATSDLRPRNTKKLHPPVACSLNFEGEIRKVLISLVEASARILTPSPESEEVFEIIKERLENKGVEHIVKQLTNMGFPSPLVVEALQINSMNPRLALDWLLKHSTVRPGGLCEKMSDDSVVSNSSGNETGSSELNKKEKNSVIQTVASLLESFRVYRRQYFKPNPKALHKLKEMGFAEEDIIDALRITGNHETSACEWLIGERQKSVDNLDTGLNPDSPVYRAIMANPVIQLSLTNPKMILAFLSMLENPSNTNIWINDPDTAPVLSQIFKTYHTEKHVFQ